MALFNLRNKALNRVINYKLTLYFKRKTKYPIMHHQFGPPCTRHSYFSLLLYLINKISMIKDTIAIFMGYFGTINHFVLTSSCGFLWLITQ